ncbi:FeoC-like transcriptional regulator [Methanolobus sp. ZRKC5]|uniref:FeoC-like transcriptional regulator n=1 Tax=unclassified Methanolobus TaxID=2629569 RepID=UPI00313F03E8
MVVGYKFFLKRIATIMDSKENLIIWTIAGRLNLRQDEFRNLLNIMEKKGDIECTAEGEISCGGNCPGCSKLCAGPELSAGNSKIKSYRLTEKGRKNCGRVS